MEIPYGSWPSPFHAADIATAAPRIDGAQFVGDEIWWGESVPAESGRVGVRSSSGAVILKNPWSARSRVHEYGGGAWTAADDGTLFFVDARSQRVHRQLPGSEPEPLTPAGPQYGGLRLQYGALLAVQEDLTSAPHRRALVEIPLDGAAAADATKIRTFVSGTGFFAHPALSPDGERIAFVTWDEAHMPWQQASLHIAAVDGSATTALPSRAALQPEWLSPTELIYSDDPNGRWGLHHAQVDGAQLVDAPRPIAPTDADVGYGLWVLGNRWYRPLDDGRIVAVRTNGSDTVVLIDAQGTATPLSVPATAHVSVDDARGPLVLLSGGAADAHAGLWCVNVNTGAVERVRGGGTVDTEWIPAARALTVDGAHGVVHAFDFAPRHPQVTAPTGEKPPYVVFVHGGPTAHVAGAASAAIAYYTSRGIGVLDVNYGGSTGYGRAYRERLDGQWGIVDVDDVMAAATGLADSGAADPQRIAIRGGSAGGWTVLSALVRGGVFGAGISRYGVTDLRALAADTHDFERHYLTGLVGPLPEAEQVYIERSPLSNADRIDVPVLLQTGAEDPVVPAAQSEAIRDALAARGIPHTYVEFAGEGHGFRRAETIIAALEGELTFLGEAFGFTPEL